MQDILIKAGCYVAIIVMGYVLRQRGFFGPEAFGVLSKVVLRITLPCAIISSAAGQKLDASMLVVLMFAPIGTAVPVFTRELGEDEGLSSAINSVSIIISIVIIVTLLTVML